MILLPIKGGLDKVIEWKIWVLITTLENLDLQQENEELLQSPARQINCHGGFQTDVSLLEAEMRK